MLVPWSGGGASWGSRAPVGSHSSANCDSWHPGHVRRWLGGGCAGGDGPPTVLYGNEHVHEVQQGEAKVEAHSAWLVVAWPRVRAVVVAWRTGGGTDGCGDPPECGGKAAVAHVRDLARHCRRAGEGAVWGY
jgi:hypothetical protein